MPHNLHGCLPPTDYFVVFTDFLAGSISMWMRILTDALGMMMFIKNRHQQRTGRKQEKSTLPQPPALFIFVRRKQFTRRHRLGVEEGTI